MTLRTLDDGSAQHDNNFNLIRLVAAWLVIYGHSYPITATSGPDLLQALVQIKFAGGIAVDMFFVISGFLIAASLERNRLPQYLTARALRIFPAMIVCVGLCVLVLGPLLTTSADYWTSAQTWKYLWKNISLAKNARFFLPGVFESLPNKAINGSLWSLPIEFRLYLLLGLVGVLRLLRPIRFNVLYVVAIALGFFVFGDQPLRPERANLVWCTAYFFTGTFAWVNRARIPLVWPLLAAVLVLAAVLRGTDHYYIAYFVAVAYTTLFLAYVPKLPRIRRHDLSYGLYLYGWPSQQLVQHFAPGGAIANTVWATLLAGGLAALSWRFVEQPALRLKQRLGTREVDQAQVEPTQAQPVPASVPADVPASG